MDLVIYIGNTCKVNGICKSAYLVPGKIYEIYSIRIERDTQTTYYTLNGIKGEFKSTFFEEISSMPVYFAVSSMVPSEGDFYYCHRLEIIDGNGTVQTSDYCTSRVKQVELIGSNTYRLITQNSIYIVTIM